VGRTWRPDGRASHLESAALRSADRLAVDTIDRYFLHAPDPRTDLAVSARALRRLVDRGAVRQIGVANVTVGQLRTVLAHVPVACVQVEVSPVAPNAVRSGVVELARELGIEVWAYRPLGGADRVGKVLRSEVVGAVAAKHGVTAGAVVLAWLADLGLVPLPGPTRDETLDACFAGVALDAEDRDRLDVLGLRQLRRPRADRRPGPSAREVRIVMGSPGAGKTSRVAPLDGWARLNRDARGGTLEDLLPALDALLAAGAERVVLDNTYPSRAARNAVIETAWAHGVPVTCELLDTSPDDAEVNAIGRILDQLGRLPEPAEIEALNKDDPSILPPRALSRYREQLEPPSADEGFERLDVVPFVRRPSPGTRRAVLLDPRDLVPSEVPALRAELDAGAIGLVVGFGAEPAAAIEARARALGLEVHAATCPHGGGPPVCWCRKPLPGLLLVLLREHGCDPARSIAWGTSPADRSLARKLGIPLRA
jgi:diketogulonate reductase-like aldo/keto reductase